MNLIEWIGVITGILAVYLLYKNNIYTWPIGFINIACFLWLFWNQNLFGDFLVQILFLITGIGGWIFWQKKDLKIPTTLNQRQLILSLTFTLILIPIAHLYLKNYTICSFPILEASILILSIVGQILTALRKIENWYYWILADLLMIIVYLQKGLYPTAVYATIVLVIGCFGLIQWRHMIKKTLLFFYLFLSFSLQVLQ